MRRRELIFCAVGNIFTELCRHHNASFALLFLMEVLELSATDVGVIFLVAQLITAFFASISGYLADKVEVPFLSKKLGGRKSWHLLATVLLAIVVPLYASRCYPCIGNHHSWLPIVYYGFLNTIYGMFVNIMEVNYSSFIATVADSVEEYTAISTVRTMFSFISGIFIYIVAWGLLGQDKSDNLGPHSLPEFLYLACILSGTGVFLAAIFHIGVREPKTRVRRKSTISSLMNAPGIYLNAFGSQNADTRRRSIAYNFVDMILATTEYEKKQSKMSECGKSGSHECRRRKRSLLQKFVEALFSDGETDNNSQNQDQLHSATEETTKNPESGDVQTRMVLEVQHLNPERKRSLLMGVLDGLVFRLQQEEQEQLACINGFGGQITKDGANECVTVENFWKAGQEEIESAPDEGEWELTNNAGSAEDKNGNEEEGSDREDQNKTSVDDSTQNSPKQDCMEELGNDREDQNESIPGTSFQTKHNQRKRGIAHFPVGSTYGLSNSGFEDDEIDGDRKRSLSNTLEGNRRKSVHFSSSEFSGKLSMNEIERQSLNLDYMPKKKTSLEECTQNYPQEDCREDEGIETCESRNESSAGGDNPELLGVPVPLTNGERGPERKHPKGIKEWLRDPGLYKVAIIFACSRHAMDLTNSYLPLFLTETLLFPKESTAYFPLILLISASLASSTSNKLNNKIGSKWSYLLAGLSVMGGAVWSYFQTVSTRQSFYAPVVIIGSGMSIMHVMALVFIMELIGENKENSGSVFAIIDVITRVSNGLVLLGIQEFYPNERTSSKDAVTNYVRHVFALTAGILALVGSLVVLFFQPSKFVNKTKGKDIIGLKEFYDNGNMENDGKLFLNFLSVNGLKYSCSCRACQLIDRQRTVDMYLPRHESGYHGFAINIQARFGSHWVVSGKIFPNSYFDASQDVEDQLCQPSFDVQVPQCPAEEAASINSPDTYKNNQTVTVHSCSEKAKL